MKDGEQKMNWKSALRAVGEISSGLAETMEQLARAIEGALEGRFDQELLTHLVGGNHGEELIAQLDAIGRSRVAAGDAEGTQPLWSVLRGLPIVLRELSSVLGGAAVYLDGYQSLKDGLSRIEQPPSDAPSETFRCPRCHSRQVHFNVESLGDGRRLVEIGCLYCGLDGDRVTHDPFDPIQAIAEWRAPSVKPQ